MIEDGYEIKRYELREGESPNSGSYVMSYCYEVSPQEGYFEQSTVGNFFDAILGKGVMVYGKSGVGKSTFIGYIASLMQGGKTPKRFRNAEFLELNYQEFFRGVNSDEMLCVRLESIFGELLERENDVFMYMGEVDEFFGSFLINTHIHDVFEGLFVFDTNVHIVFTCTDTGDDRKMLQSDDFVVRHLTRIHIPEPDNEGLKNIGLVRAASLAKRYGMKYKTEDIVRAVSLGRKYLRSGDYGFTRDICNFIDMIFGHAALLNRRTLTMTHIQDVLSSYAGVERGSLNSDERAWLRGMPSKLSSIVIGQEESVDTVCKAVSRSKMGLRTGVHTVGNFLFVGPTGVGKTLLAKTISSYLFGREDYLVRFDMSEYTDDISVNKLIGAPPGYVGYGDGSLLCDALDKHRDGVILFDEIEKAHTRIFDVLLQLLDEGRVTNSTGRTYDATGYIIIMTSNVGVRDAMNFKGRIGFGGDEEGVERERRDIISKSIKAKFAPEFLNRIDRICYFNPLGKSEMFRIFDNEYDKLRVILEEKGYVPKLAESVRENMVEMAMEQNMGARPIVRAIEQNITDSISDMMVNEELEREFTLDWDAGRKRVLVGSAAKI